LVSNVVPEAELHETARALANSFVRSPAFSFGVAKKLFKSMAVPSLEAFLDAEAWAQEACLLSADHREGVAAFLEKRPANFGAG
jgi:2-(1,2-epoxy-1,2-dihydrophenyl)acetyl-CoA isomerase